MKTMTCSQLGGACEPELHGETADEVIKQQDAHLKEVVDAGDSAHGPALREMKGQCKHPISGMKWYKQVKADFAGLRED